MDIKIFKNNKAPIYMQIKNQIKELILNGEFQEGILLPSERKMAVKMGIHRNTITKAYQELRADGYIEPSQGVGYKVIYNGNILSTNVGKKGYGSIPWAHLIRPEFLDYEKTFDDIFAQSYSGKGISFAGGIVPAEAYHKDDIKTILRDIAESETDDIIYEYSHYQGLSKLRQNISMFLRERNISTNIHGIQVMNDTNHAIDYICELFINQGDVVITEEPVSPDIHRALRLSGAKVITVPMDNEGILVDTVEALAVSKKPKFIYVSSSFNDPTGLVMSLNRRKQLLEISYKYKIPIIEDDCASEIRFSKEKIASIKSLDKNNSVIYIYSFALTFVPGLKLAFIVAPKLIITKVSYLLSMHIVNIDSLMQIIVSKYIERGLYDKNLKHICKCYQEKRDLMCDLLNEAKQYGLEFDVPIGGVYVWCRLGSDIDTSKFMRMVRKNGVYIMPGNIFFPNGNIGENYIRLNYSYPTKEDIKKGCKVIVFATKESRI